MRNRFRRTSFFRRDALEDGLRQLRHREASRQAMPAPLSEPAYGEPAAMNYPRYQPPPDFHRAPEDLAHLPAPFPAATFGPPVPIEEPQVPAQGQNYAPDTASVDTAMQQFFAEQDALNSSLENEVVAQEPGGLAPESPGMPDPTPEMTPHPAAESIPTPMLPEREPDHVLFVPGGF